MATRDNINQQLLGNLEQRIRKLEKAVFPKGDKEKNKVFSRASILGKGPKVGILQIISGNFLNSRKTAVEVKDKLLEKGYDYRIQVVQTTLNRLSNRNGPLTAFKVNGKKLYVKRK